MKHFPAPWRIEGEFDDGIDVEIRAADDRLVCEISAFTGEWTEEEIANARMIAATPELLEVLKEVEEYRIGDSVNLPQWLRPKIKAAIAKTEVR